MPCDLSWQVLLFGLQERTIRVLPGIARSVLLLAFEKTLRVVVALGIDADLNGFQAQSLLLQGFLETGQVLF